MLRRLSLRDFVIVSSVDVDFEAGFTVLTGETGAGKSRSEEHTSELQSH